MKRILSYIIDFGIGTLLLVILIYASLALLRTWIDLSTVSDFEFNLVFGALGHLLLYSITSLPAALFGKTLGQYVTGIRLVRDSDSNRISVIQSIVLYLTFMLVSVLLTVGIGIIIAMFRKDGKGLHNMICRTKMIEINNHAG